MKETVLGLFQSVIFVSQRKVDQLHRANHSLAVRSKLEIRNPCTLCKEKKQMAAGREKKKKEEKRIRKKKKKK